LVGSKVGFGRNYQGKRHEGTKDPTSNGNRKRKKGKIDRGGENSSKGEVEKMLENRALLKIGGWGAEK